MDIPLFDAHCDTASAIWNKSLPLRKNTLHTDLVRRMSYAPCAQFFAFFAQGADAPVKYRNQLNYFKSQAAENKDLIIICRTHKEAEDAFSSGRTAAFLAIEGAELLNCSETELKKAHDEGIRSVNITWNFENVLSGSNSEGADKGLTDRGKSFVKRCQELGMLIDMSHISEKAFWDAYELGGTMFASHSNSSAVWPHSRNLTDAQFRALAETGGVAGLNLYSRFLGEDPDTDTVVAHAEHFLSLGGENALCIGADFDGCDELPRKINGIDDMSCLYEAFLRRNYNESLVRNIFFNNLFALLERTLNNEICQHEKHK